ncbi:MAG: hypothetical protein H0W72_16985 [Planctomycetes bacterium]|nr:hypothetical protein [Planctomycetota bacterium]
MAAFAFTAIAALLFAEVEIQIEGAGGWGSTLPTWRVEEHWLLDIFWGGRAMTGYHAFVFPFIALLFHFPIVALGTWSLRLEARILGCIMLFWVIEDLLWFALNPHYGWAKLTPAVATWHPHWLFGFPTEYSVFGVAGVALIWYASTVPRAQRDVTPSRAPAGNP